MIWVGRRVKRLVVFDLNFSKYVPEYNGMEFKVLFVKGIKVSITGKLT